ncbi:MAG: NAD-dependent epimerase/dehydratase family protein [Sphingobacteriales bacterium]|nr:NAD-dependent epimerase/dehydratase family protein [Sphingobacteriales bacterium]
MVLVTGASGFLGGELVKQLVADGESVRILVRPTSSITHFAPILDKIEIALGDILDIPSLEAALEGVDKIYHSAAIIGYDSSYYDAMYKTNIEGTANVVNVALTNGIKKLLHVSSIAAIGGKPEELITEETKWEKNQWTTHYGITKMLAEREIWRGIQEGLEAAIINPGIIVGICNDEHKATIRLFKQIATRKLPFYTNGTNGFIDVEDTAKAAIQLMNSEIHSARFIVVSENISFKDYFEQVARALEVAPPGRVLNPLLAKVFVTADWFFSKLSDRKRKVTQEALKVAMEKFEYDNHKIREALKFNFIPLEKTIKKVANTIKSDSEPV